MRLDALRRVLHGGGLKWWLLPLLTTGLLLGVEAVTERLFDEGRPAKGATARFTLRAEADAVLDLHETHAAEAIEAQQSYVPIYEQDDAVLAAAKEQILNAVLERPVSAWGWPETGGADSEAWYLAAADGGARRDGGEPALDGGATERAPQSVALERRAEIEALVRGCFELLAPLYAAGVVADTEFPREKAEVRLLTGGRYLVRAVAQLHRFSALREQIALGAKQFFFKSDPRVRSEVIEYILQRLPANLSYARENDKFIADISQVTGLKIVLIRRGSVLAARGEVIDTRAFYALRASEAALAGLPWLQRHLGRFGLVAALLLVFSAAARMLCPTVFVSLKPLAVIYGVMVVLVASGKLVLALWPVGVGVLPLASSALIIAVVYGRAPAVLAAIATATCMAFVFYFDLGTIVIGAGGGVVAALVVRRRRGGAVAAAGVLIGLAQAFASEAARAAEGRPQTYAELWSSAQGLLGGLIAGLVALLVLPFVQRWVGQASRGKLMVLGDFDHALMRLLRERLPQVFSHSVRVVNLADRAAQALGADRALTRVGALLHDLGQLEAGPQSLAGGRELEALAERRRAHVEAGLVLAAAHNLPAEVTTLIAEHHGTLPMTELMGRPPGMAPAPGAREELPRFRGPCPRSVESAIVMVANRVEHATQGVASAAASGQIVEQVVLELQAELQFVDCGLTQRQLVTLQQAIAQYLETTRA
ncbi:MAG: HDIG domain-containing protein [Proteobacteria bacterium]|nr:HDIG domain-containing protein [Pseudomonadota bacterium]